MPKQVVWLPPAVADVARLRGFLKSKNPLAAQRAASRIIEGIKLLKESPSAGAPVDNMLDFCELMLSFGAGEYIIRYREEATRIVIVRIRHSKEQAI